MSKKLLLSRSSSIPEINRLACPSTVGLALACSEDAGPRPLKKRAPSIPRCLSCSRVLSQDVRSAISITETMIRDEHRRPSRCAATPPGHCPSTGSAIDNPRCTLRSALVRPWVFGSLLPEAECVSACSRSSARLSMSVSPRRRDGRILKGKWVSHALCQESLSSLQPRAAPNWTACDGWAKPD